MRSLKINLEQLFKLSLIVIIIPFLFGCSKKLSREEAEKQIKQKIQMPQNEYREFSNIEPKAYTKWTEYDLNYDCGWGKYTVPKTIDVVNNYLKSNLLETLEKENCITIEILRSEPKEIYGIMYGRREFSNTESYKAVFTNKAKPYVDGNLVKVSTLEFGEITGIIERGELNIAEVNYTVKRDNITPFGLAYKINPEILNRSATFTKFDDGWRIGN